VPEARKLAACDLAVDNSGPGRTWPERGEALASCAGGGAPGRDRAARFRTLFDAPWTDF
jgi:hypothetical protein